MAYDPTLTSFIVVAVIGGSAAVMNASAEWELGHELSRATDRWTKLEVVRTYAASMARDRSSREAAMLFGHGYEAVPEERCGPMAAAATVTGETRVCFRRTRTA